ncbi:MULTISPECIES: phage tail tape measure protein [unclassified Pseudomonas]|uniref:phage tail tape measure protein n=1 Tax=unclassified Pseudomonas TaxID=196821 RepID=UPI000877134F|nr:MULTISPECIES: phage tail tape measure protein [unclassified Pseudomonas]SCZ74093.1 phage tail tape measure protein, lambda family [Pseudomonas sp. NFPP17]SDA81144.1 phage tail tape measure protein, lambda family [Pseudomonas sp. NFPP15]SEL78007.1 phage tail tape measure protein, lambda family [Pseudomonas sp. NFPP18]SFA66684.1 phage tail tape measure protein, lambda family [Pseudomonas sp. NFPP13]SFU07926.1 phage tail tape measure protein, lambda family [Pseudomonas sp. NFPP25]
MSTTFASLGIAVESSQAVKAADDLDKLVDAAEGAEKAVDDLGKAGEGLANTGKKISQAEAEAAQGIDKATSAKERQVDASRKAGISAASEIAIISQLDRAMTGNIDSMEKLVQAEGLLERARKGGLVTIEQQEAYQERLGKSFDKIEKAEAKEMAQKQRLIDAENRQIEALKRTVNSIDPLNVKLAKLEAQEKAAHEAFRLGAINADRYSEALAKVGKDRAGITATEGAFDKLKLGTRQAQENVMQLTNALQSGDWGSGVRAVAQLGAGAGASAASLLALAAPIALVTAAIGGLAYAYYKGSEEQDAFDKSLILTGGSAGLTASQLGVMAKQVSDMVGTTGQAAEVLTTLAGNGKIAGESFLGITQAAVSMQEATGKAVGDTIAEFVKLADEPVKASAALNEQYHYLTTSVYSQIVALEEQGRHAEAVKLATDQYADAINDRTPKILENLSLWEKGYNLVAKAADNLKSAGRSQSNAERIQTAKEALERLETRGGSERIPGEDPVYIGEKGKQSLRDYIKGLEVKDAAETDYAKRQKERNAIMEAGQKAIDKLDARKKATRSNADKRKDELEDLEKELAALRVSDPTNSRLTKESVDGQKAAINSKYKDTKTAASAVDLTAFNNSKNNLTGILSEYKNAQKELDAAQKSGLVSQADYLLKREALIGNERDEVTAAYEAEIAALEAAKGKASTSAAQRIQLDQKIADARAAMVKAQRDADTELSVLAKNEEGRLKKQELAVKTYTSALQQQVDTLREQGLRAAAGLGQGGRQRDLTNQHNAIDDRINQQKLDLANQYGDGSRGMSLDEYTQKLQALEATQQKLHDTVVSNYDDMTAAQGDWRNGASSAWQNYLESARDVAGQTKSLFTNAFGSMEDAIVQFAMTGKLSFADFTKSILADMARIAVRQASSSALSSLFGMAASAAGSYFGGGAASAGSTQAGYTGVDFSSYQANGGGWDGGVQFFKDGGAFTNSIVSKPTAFGMAGGKTGVVGEAGPEAIVPLARTSGGQLGIRALGGGSSSSNNQVVIQQTFNVPEGSGGASEADGQVLAQAYAKSAKQGAQEQIAKDLRPGGQIYMAIRGRG